MSSSIQFPKKKTKFPKSSNDVQCVSKCYKKSTNITHPVTLERTTNINGSFCAIIPTQIDGNLVTIDECLLPPDDMNEYSIDSQKQKDEWVIQQNDELNLLYPFLDFNPRDFMKKYYGIRNIGDFYLFLKNNASLPIFTKLRLMDCFIDVFGEGVSVLDVSFIDTINDIIKKFWIKQMYAKLCNYITVKQDVCELTFPENNTMKKSDSVQLRTKYIVSQIATHQTVSESVNEYFSNISKKTNPNMSDVCDFLVESFITKMIQTLNKKL